MKKLLLAALALCATPAHAAPPPIGVVLAACDADARAKISDREPTSVRALVIANGLTADEQATLEVICKIYEAGMLGGLRMMAEPRT